MHSNQIYIENDRILIRSLNKEDISGIRAMQSDSQIYRFEPTFLTERHGAPEEALTAIRNMDLRKDRQCILGVFTKDDPSVFVGLAEFYDYKPSGKGISIGYRLLSAHWGKGIATKTVQAMIGYLRNNTEVELVTAHVIPDNKASSRCLLKNGFEYLVTKTEDWGYDRPVMAEVYTLDI